MPGVFPALVRYDCSFRYTGFQELVEGGELEHDFNLSWCIGLKKLQIITRNCVHSNTKASLGPIKLGYHVN